MHIDVRWIHPVLFIGLRSFILVDAPRSITIDEALARIS
jgi:hypothetical protein